MSCFFYALLQLNIATYLVIWYHDKQIIHIHKLNMNIYIYTWTMQFMWHICWFVYVFYQWHQNVFVVVHTVLGRHTKTHWLWMWLSIQILQSCIYIIHTFGTSRFCLITYKCLLDIFWTSSVWMKVTQQQYSKGWFHAHIRLNTTIMYVYYKMIN